MPNFHGIVETPKRSFINGFSICMTVTLKQKDDASVQSQDTNIKSTLCRALF